VVLEDDRAPRVSLPARRVGSVLGSVSYPIAREAACSVIVVPRTGTVALDAGAGVQERRPSRAVAPTADDVA